MTRSAYVSVAPGNLPSTLALSGQVKERRSRSQERRTTLSRVNPNAVQQIQLRGYESGMKLCGVGTQDCSDVVGCFANPAGDVLHPGRCIKGNESNHEDLFNQGLSGLVHHETVEPGLDYLKSLSH
jgi:hypothetical protein